MDTVAPPARFDPRGLGELDERVPGTAEIEGERASFDARELTTRQINLELRRLVYELAVGEVTVRNPGAKHSLGVGILARCRITFEGSLGYFGCGLLDGPEVPITGRVGWSACENMMSGVCVIDGKGAVVFEGKAAADPISLAELIRAKAPKVVRVGMETGATSPWLFRYYVAAATNRIGLVRQG